MFWLPKYLVSCVPALQWTNHVSSLFVSFHRCFHPPPLQRLKQHRQHRQHMAERSAHSLRDAHAAQNYFAAGGEGRDEIAAGKHKAAMREMARNAAQNLHSMGHEHGPAVRDERFAKPLPGTSLARHGTQQYVDENTNITLCTTDTTLVVNHKSG